MRRHLAVAFAMCISNPIHAQSIELPDIGDPSQQYLGPSDELRIGQAIIAKARDRDLIMDDPLATEYLEALGNRIAINSNGATNPFHFFWVKDGTLNAFALPGGFIGVNIGLMLATKNESELAGVVAHEIAHVAQHHITRSYADQQSMSVPMMAAMLAGMAVAAASGSSGGQLGQAVAAGSIAMGAQRQISFTRAAEQEADRIGSDLLKRAGYDPNGLTSFFSRLENLTGAAAQIPEFLRSHPLVINRMADTQARTDTKSTRRSAGDEALYRLIRERLRVLASDNAPQLVRDYEARLASGSNDADRYGYTLALARSNHLDAAAAEIARLRRSSSDSLPLRLEEASISLTRGETSAAWEQFETARRLYPSDYTLAIIYGEALITRGDPRLAASILDNQLRRHSDRPELFELYARASERKGDVAGKYLAMTEYYMLSGNLKAAAEQAEIGVRTGVGTPQQQAQLRARLTELKRLRGQQKSDTLLR